MPYALPPSPTAFGFRPLSIFRFATIPAACLCVQPFCSKNATACAILLSSAAAFSASSCRCAGQPCAPAASGAIEFCLSKGLCAVCTREHVPELPVFAATFALDEFIEI